MSKKKANPIIQSDFNKSAFYRKLDNPKVILVIVSLFFLLYFLPYLVKNQDAYISQFDNLDQISYLGHFDGHFQGHFLPTDDIEENYLPGIEPVFRLAIVSFAKIFWLFGFFPGYVLNEFFYRLLSFLGMYLLLRCYLTKKLPRLLPALIAVSYIYLPFWPQGGLSISGLPLLAYLLLNIHFGKKLLISYIFLLIYIFYSSFFLTGIFVLFILGLIIFIRLITRKSFIRLLPPFLMMTVVYVITNYPFFLINFVDKIPTNRAEIQLLSVSFAKAFQELFLNYFAKSHLHAHSYQKYLLLPAAIVTLIAALRKRDFPIRKVALILGGFTIMAAFLFSVYRYKPLNDWYTSLGFGFDYSRFFFLNPPVWYLLPALGIAYGYNVLKSKKTFLLMAVLLILIQIGINYQHSSLQVWSTKPSFREVMSTQQFDKIEAYLVQNKPDFSKADTLIGCIGFQPSVANFNGFKTLGAYCPIYPLHIKDVFLEVLEDEMAKSKRLEIYMQKWGSQLYLFDDEIFINMLNQKDLRRNIRSITCDLNIRKLKKLGVDYLFTTAKISNADEKKLEEIYYDTGIFGYYRIFVYAL